jgi:hypothetical protein
VKARALIAVLVIAAGLAAGAWWFSPWWVLNQVKAAAERNDAQALSDVIDYPRLRESLKAELNSALVGRLREGASGLGEIGRTGAALGAVLASAVVDKLVEVMVRPEFVVRAIRDGQFVLPGRSANERDRGPGAGGSGPQAGGDAQGGASRSGSGAQRGGAAPGPWRSSAGWGVCAGCGAGERHQ